MRNRDDYVQNIAISGYTIYLNRIQNNGTAYVDADQDMIMNREGDSLKVVDIATKNTDEKETQVLSHCRMRRRKRHRDSDTERDDLRAET